MRWLPYAIACARHQKYRNREILILSSGGSAGALDSDNDLRHVAVSRRGLSVGELRNIGCSNARGDLVAHFDDDDYSAPDRIGVQVDWLRAADAAVCGFRSMRFTDGRQWWQYTGSPLYALGTSLLYRRDWWTAHPFRNEMVGEDNSFVGVARSANKLVCGDAGELQYATIHAANTSPRNRSGGNWRLL